MERFSKDFASGVMVLSKRLERISGGHVDVR